MVLHSSSSHRPSPRPCRPCSQACCWTWAARGRNEDEDSLALSFLDAAAGFFRVHNRGGGEVTRGKVAGGPCGDTCPDLGLRRRWSSKRGRLYHHVSSRVQGEKSVSRTNLPGSKTTSWLLNRPSRRPGSNAAKEEELGFAVFIGRGTANWDHDHMLPGLSSYGVFCFRDGFVA